MKKSPSSSVKLYTNVGTFRKYAKLKPSVVSERVGISRSTLHRIEHGHIIPSVLVALQLAACLKVPVDDLFTLKNKPALTAEQKFDLYLKRILNSNKKSDI